MFQLYIQMAKIIQFNSLFVVSRHCLFWNFALIAFTFALHLMLLSGLSWVIDLKAFLVIFTCASHAPPIQGIAGAINFRYMFWLFKWLYMLLWPNVCNTFLNSLSTPTKLEPLSGHIVFGFPFLDTKCLNTNMNESVLKLPTNSRCTDRVVGQMNNVPCLLIVFGEI